jgi:hypothetical protein
VERGDMIGYLSVLLELQSLTEAARITQKNG